MKLAVEFGIYLLAAFGFAYIAGHSSITFPLRAWLGGIPAQKLADEHGVEKVVKYAVPGALGAFGEFVVTLIECPACLGFWTGFLCGAFGLGKSLVEGWPHPFLWSICLGCATSGFNFIVGRSTRLI